MFVLFLLGTVASIILFRGKSLSQLNLLHAQVTKKITNGVSAGTDVADIFLMVPFSVFVIIPGAEIFIPFYIKRFPSAMPSTFETADQKNDRQIKAARARIELATFMHETLDEMVRKQKATTSAKMLDFIKFVKEVRQNGRWITNEDFKKYAPLFQDELTIDKMDRPTLLALCKIFKTNPGEYTLNG